jgi:hypothetical protein
MSERWAQKLSLAKLAQIKERLGLEELTDGSGGPFRTVTSARDGSDCGETRILVGDGAVKKVVYHALQADFIGLDSHMVFAFGAPDSLLPHWTFDSVLNAPDYAYHLDLIPRVDLAANLAYMDYVYGPLTEVFNTGREHPGILEARIGPRQRSIMSQWMLAYRVPAEEYPKIDTYVQAYLDRWYDLVDHGIPDEIADSVVGATAAARDEANRGIIFNRDVDHVWDLITPLVGDAQSELMRAQLATNDIIESVDEDFTVAAPA